jgi:hypothetical protein
LITVAVKVTDVPAQTVWFGVAIVTDGVTVGSMVIVTAEDVADTGEGQLADEVITHDTVWPLVRAPVV